MSKTYVRDENYVMHTHELKHVHSSNIMFLISAIQ